MTGNVGSRCYGCRFNSILLKSRHQLRGYMVSVDSPQCTTCMEVFFLVFAPLTVHQSLCNDIACLRQYCSVVLESQSMVRTALL